MRFLFLGNGTPPSTSVTGVRVTASTVAIGDTVAAVLLHCFASGLIKGPFVAIRLSCEPALSNKQTRDKNVDSDGVRILMWTTAVGRAAQPRFGTLD